MLNLLRCRRGTMAFVFVIAAVPLIGMVALGAEAGSWYVTKQHAQNAADAAAYSGALRLACTVAAQTTCDTETVDQRAKQFAAQNAFCNAGDTTTPGCPITLAAHVSQAVTISTLTTWNSIPGNYVEAIVAQTEPVYLAGVLGLSSVSPGALAVAQVKGVAKPPCALALTGSISFQGSPNILAPTCGMASNDPANNALDFTGGGMTINLGSLSAAGGCKGTSTFCGTALTYMPPISDPFSALNSVTLPTLQNCTGSGLTAYSAATPCTNNNITFTGSTKDVPLSGSGVYFISGILTLKGQTTIETVVANPTAKPPSPAGTALFILMPGASIDIKSGSININANASVTSAQLPPALQPYANLFANMSIYDASGTQASPSSITLGGNSDLTFNGNLYAPNAIVTFQGNPTVNACGQLIAYSIAFNGNATFDNSGCSTVGAPKLTSQQYVALVQ